MNLLSKKSQTNIFILYKVDEPLRTIFWENQPTWSMASQNLVILGYFVHIIGLIDLTKYFSHLTNISGFMAFFFPSVSAKMGFFRILAQNILRSLHGHKDFVLFQQSFLHEITQKNNPMFVPTWAGPKISIQNCQNCNENPDFMVKNTPTPT